MKMMWLQATTLIIVIFALIPESVQSEDRNECQWKMKDGLWHYICNPNDPCNYVYVNGKYKWRCKPTTPVDNGGSCFEKGVDYFGNDLSNGQYKSTPTAAACQAHCQASPGCNFWTWDPGYNNACWKKTAKGPKKSVARLTSGPKNCDQNGNDNDNAGSGCQGVNIFGHEPLTRNNPPFQTRTHTSPPGHLIANHLKSKPLPTTAWWQNLVLGSGGNRINILPYQVKAQNDALQVCYPKKTVTSKYVSTGFLQNLIFGASEGLFSRQVVDFDELSVTVR